MLNDAKVIIDSHTKNILESITKQIADEIRSVFNFSDIKDSVDEIKPMLKKLEIKISEVKEQQDAFIEAIKNIRWETDYEGK